MGRGRPPVEGITYFPFFCGFFDDEKIQVLHAQCGGDRALMVLLRLWCKIYKVKGYYYICAGCQFSLLAREMGFGGSAEFVKEVVNTCVAIGLFDQGLYQQYHVLTNPKIQTYYLHAIKDRVENDPSQKPFWLLCGGALPENVKKASKPDFLPRENTQKEKKRNLSYYPKPHEGLLEKSFFGKNLKEGEVEKCFFPRPPCQISAWVFKAPPGSGRPPQSKTRKTREPVLFTDSSFIRDPLWRGLFDKWVAHRVAFGLGHLTTSGADKFYKKMHYLSSGNYSLAQQIVENSIKKEWKSIFELPKNYKNGQKNKPRASNSTSQLSGTVTYRTDDI